MATIAAILGRILIAILFVVAGANQIMDTERAGADFLSAGLDPSLVIPAAVIQIVAGLALALGFATRIASLVLFAFTALTILFFHRDFNDPAQVDLLWLNLAVAGGLLLTFAYGHLVGSWKTVRARREGEVEANEARAETYQAELDKARAEGRAEGLAEAARGRDDTDVVVERPVVDTDGDGKADT